jgi:hypothetical protein
MSFPTESWLLQSRWRPETVYHLFIFAPTYFRIVQTCSRPLYEYGTSQWMSANTTHRLLTQVPNDLTDWYSVTIWRMKSVTRKCHPATKVRMYLFTYLTANTSNKSVSNKFIAHIQHSTGFGSMGPSSGRFFYIMSKRNYIKYMAICMT